MTGRAMSTEPTVMESESSERDVRRSLNIEASEGHRWLIEGVVGPTCAILRLPPNMWPADGDVSALRTRP